MDRRLRTVTVIAVVSTLLLLGAGAFAAVRTAQLRAAHAEQERLERKLSAAAERIARLEDPDNGGEDGPQDSEGPDGPDGLEGLEGLEDLERLFGEGGDLGKMLEDLLGGEQGPAGGLGGMADLASCVATSERVEVDDDDSATQLDDIEAAVEELRSLQFTDEVEPTYLTQDEIGERITASIDEEYTAEQADIDRRYLAALGAASPDLDLRETHKELLGGQVAGFYDSDTGEMVVGAADRAEPLGPTDQVTLAHELTHALADQQLTLPEVLDEEVPDTDAALAALALVEGDATLVMQRYALAALDVSEQMSLATDPRSAQAQKDLGAFPHLLQRQLVFPYEAGLRFACSLGATGGWGAVDAAYGKLPTTTAQILFPERYGEPVPAAPAVPTAPGQGWEQARTDTLGAAELKWLFEAPGDDPSAALSDPLERVAHWDAGTAVVWTAGDETALGFVLRDRGGPGPSLCESVVDWYDAAFDDDRGAATSGDERLALEGGYQSGVVACAGDEVTVGAAPDLETARRIAG